MNTRICTQGRHSRARIQAGLAAAAGALLVACGGGGGTDTVTTPVVITKFTGVAATGAALAGATVRVKCAVGAASGTTAADGSYTLEVSGATLPCVLSAVSADGKTELRSLADPAGGNTQVIQINPVTELVVARLAAQDATLFFNGFDAAAAAKVTTAAIQTAVAAVVGTLKDGGVDLTALGNPLTATLIAATVQAPGNAYDQALDALSAKLALAGTTLPQLATQVVAQAQGSTGSGPGAADASLPVAALLRPAHAECAALRTGPYRFINSYGPSQISAELVQVDGPGASITWAQGSVSKATATGGCTFQINDPGLQMRFTVSPAGVIVALTAHLSAPTVTMAIALPEQPARLADLAGEWNWATFFETNQPSGGPRAMDMGLFTFNAGGALTAVSNCSMQAACVGSTNPMPDISVNAEGAFELRPDGALHARFFLYRPGNGDPVMVLVKETEIMMASKVAARGLPALNDSWSRMDASVNPQMLAGDGFTFSTFTATAVDAGNQSYVRRRSQDGAKQTFQFNSPRSGVIYRAAGSTLLDSGSTLNFSDVYVLPLGGTGVLAFGRQTTSDARSQGSFGLTVAVPAQASGGTGSVKAAASVGPGLLSWAGSTQLYALRVNLAVNAANGAINSNSYDFHTLSGTTTACTFSQANASTCFGTNGSGSTQQGGPLSANGSASATTLSMGPDAYGFTFTGTLTGTQWVGSWTKAATTLSPNTGSGSFNVNVVVTLN